MNAARHAVATSIQAEVAAADGQLRIAVVDDGHGFAPGLLVRCIRRVHEGGTWLERDSAGRALERLARREEGRRALAAALTPGSSTLCSWSWPACATRRSPTGSGSGRARVKIHLHNVYGKLGVDSRLALAAHAREKGLA